jgi:DNA-binding transcriptional ArsR family regulator
MLIESILGSPGNIAVLRSLATLPGPVSGNGLALQVGRPQSSVRLALERLVDMGVVIRRDIGRSAAYELNRKLAVVKHIVIPLVEREREVWELLAQTLAIGCTRQEGLQSTVLYGSVARREMASDVDLVLVTSQPDGKESLREAMAPLAVEVEKVFGLSLQPIVVTERELTSRVLTHLRHTLQREGIVISGSAPETLSTLPRWTQLTA